MDFSRTTLESVVSIQENSTTVIDVRYHTVATTCSTDSFFIFFIFFGGVGLSTSGTISKGGIIHRVLAWRAKGGLSVREDYT